MNDSRVNNTRRNIVYAGVFQIVKMALLFINRIIFVKILGASYLGVNGLFSNILSILSLADLGIITVLMYSLYKPLADNDEIKIQQYLNYFRKIYNIIAIVVATIGILLIPFLKYLVNLPNDMPNIYWYYIIILSNTVASYLFVYKTTLLSADQKMYIINKYDTIFQFVLFILQIIVLFITKSFTLYLLCNLICTFLSNILKAKKINSFYPYLRKKNLTSLSKNEKKKIFSNTTSTFLYRIGTVIQGNTDNILISVFVGTITVGYYSNYSTIILSVTSFLTLIFTSLKASVGNYVVKKDKDSQFNMFNILEVYNFLMVCFCSVCFFVLIPDFIKICFGDDYVLNNSFLFLLVLNFYTSNIRQTIWMYRETTGIFNKTKYITIITSIINLILSLLFGYYFGIVGIIGATILARMIYAWWREPIILFKDYFNKSSLGYFKNYIFRIILTVVIMCITYFICISIPIFNIYINFVIKILVCCVVPTIILLFIYKKNNAIIYLQKILKKDDVK